MEKECRECEARKSESCDPAYGWINCCELGNHAYSEKRCECGVVFCYACCGGQNVDQGGKYQPDYMFCPACGQDYYSN